MRASVVMASRVTAGRVIAGLVVAGQAPLALREGPWGRLSGCGRAVSSADRGTSDKLEEDAKALRAVVAGD